MKSKLFQRKVTEGFAFALGATVAGIIVYEGGKKVLGRRPKTP